MVPPLSLLLRQPQDDFFVSFFSVLFALEDEAGVF